MTGCNVARAGRRRQRRWRVASVAPSRRPPSAGSSTAGSFRRVYSSTRRMIATSPTSPSARRGAEHPAGDDVQDLAALVGECLGSRYGRAAIGERPGRGRRGSGTWHGDGRSTADRRVRGAAGCGARVRRISIQRDRGATRTRACSHSTKPMPPTSSVGMTWSTRSSPRLSGGDLASRLVLVVGGSGTGKSSVVRAGLSPRVRRGDVPGSARWFVATMLAPGRPRSRSSPRACNTLPSPRRVAWRSNSPTARAVSIE